MTNAMAVHQPLADSQGGMPHVAAPVIGDRAVRTSTQQVASVLAGLAGLFAFRVIAQPLATVMGAGVLPPFDAWHSGALPYPLLLASQVAILVALTAVVRGIRRGTSRRRPDVAPWLEAAALAYGGVMAARLLLGATIYAGHGWFDRPLPTVFHLVLAAFLWMWSTWHRDDAHRLDRALRLVPSYHYPLVIGLAFWLTWSLRQWGAPLGVSTYVPIVLTALAVATLERLAPARRDWEPTGDDLVTDGSYLVAVQLALPPLVGFVFTSLLIEPARAVSLPTAALWPHGAPIGLQAMAMVVLVDLMRYWLHRAAHERDLLWRLHAVHHSVDRLYWLNTSRFHPIEKALQMCLDSLPFLLLGVDRQVLGLYYVAYSTNGFFQHSNIDLRYGVLNYIVSSAEAHRWHHSREPREANHNYGSTTIVWDLLFGTWFLPSNHAVGALGLHDRAFPRTFWSQMRAPFTRR